MRSLQAHHEGKRKTNFFNSGHNTLRDDITLYDPSKNIDKDAFYIHIRKNNFKSLSDTLLSSTASYIQKISRSSPIKLKKIHGCHGKSCSIHQTSYVPLQSDVAYPMLRGLIFMYIFLIQ